MPVFETERIRAEKEDGLGLEIPGYWLAIAQLILSYIYKQD